MTAAPARVLLADDDDDFRTTTAALLTRDGFVVRQAATARDALGCLADGDCELLITDLEMPGNDDLALVRQATHTAPGLPVILVTGFPSIDSAISSIELPVCAYLVKPVDHDALRRHADHAVARYRGAQAVRRTEQRLERANEEFREMLAARHASGEDQDTPVDAFMGLTLHNVMASLRDLQQLGHALAGQAAPQASPCQLMDCPRGAQLHAAVQETVQVLEETKSAFKSKTLAELRHKLELLLQHG